MNQLSIIRAGRLLPCGCFKLFEMSSQTFLFYVLETRGVFKLPRPNFQKEGEKRGVRPEKKGIEHKCSVRYFYSAGGRLKFRCSLHFY